MRSTIRLISLACASSMLFACSGMGGAPAFQQAAAPQPPAGPEQAAGPDADGYYALGRAQHGALRYAAALAAYRRALQLEPAHLNARNGLAVLHAGHGEYAEAIALWRALLPAQGSGAGAGPQEAFLWGNLGYAYFLSGANEPALAALEQACLLDPLNALSWEHLGELLQRMGQGERAALMRRQAASLRQHDYRRDYALLAAGDGAAAGAPATPPPSAAATGTAAAAATGTGTAAATATATATATAAAGMAEPHAWPPALAQTEVRRESAALVSVHRVAAAAVSSSAAAVVSAPQSDSRVGFRLAALTGEDIDPAATLASVAFAPRSWATSAPARLEISNGNGVAGMAAALARTVSGEALLVVRLSNMRHFAVPASRVEYQQPQEAAARALAARLGLRVAAQGEARGSAELRIVLGRDLRDPALLRQRYLK